jgi:hypothetical protein
MHAWEDALINPYLSRVSPILFQVILQCSIQASRPCLSC